MLKWDKVIRIDVKQIFTIQGILCKVLGYLNNIILRGDGI